MGPSRFFGTARFRASQQLGVQVRLAARARPAQPLESPEHLGSEGHKLAYLGDLELGTVELAVELDELFLCELLSRAGVSGLVLFRRLVSIQ